MQQKGQKQKKQRILEELIIYAALSSLTVLLPVNIGLDVINTSSSPPPLSSLVLKALYAV